MATTNVTCHVHHNYQSLCIRPSPFIQAIYNYSYHGFNKGSINFRIDGKKSVLALYACTRNMYTKLIIPILYPLDYMAKCSRWEIYLFIPHIQNAIKSEATYMYVCVWRLK